MSETEAASSPQVLVSLRAAGKAFRGGTRALDEVTFSVARGEFVSLLGPSGCGKSTVLRLIAGLSEPSSGSVEVSARKPGASPIGFVFQEPTLMPWRTVLGNVSLPLRLAGKGRGETRDAARDAITRVGLDGFEGSYPRQLSGGMKMRVSIARALVTRPTLLLMDEPFAALDEITRFGLNEQMLAVWAEQALTCLFVTHSVFESVFLSTRILVMSARPGRIAADIPIHAPMPRAPGYRTSADYMRTARLVSEALADAMGEPIRDRAERTA